jgi:hypothetical protein
VVTKFEERIDDLGVPASSRVTAMKTVLQMNGKAIELEDLHACIDALEAAIQKHTR